MKYAFFFILFLISRVAISQDFRLANEYYINGDTEKAKAIYEELVKKGQNIPDIHSNYFTLLMQEQHWKEAQKYLERSLKIHNNNAQLVMQFQVDLLYLFHTSDQQDKASELEQQLLESYTYHHQLSILAQHMTRKEMFEYSLRFYQSARKISNNYRAYALDMAGIYRQLDRKQDMIEEYLNYALINTGNLNYVKNIFQRLLTEPGDLESLETALIRKVQQSPEETIYAQLLIWLELQRKNFYGAFLQSRALDKRMKNSGDETMRIGKIALDNQAWDDAVDIFQYVIEEFSKGYNYPIAKKLLIKAKEGVVKNQYPVDKEAIKKLTLEYQQLYQELGPVSDAFEAMRSKALLHAFYLDQQDTAISILRVLINSKRVEPKLVSYCKLDLGDIYLLTDQPWESTLLYSQVEKANKYSPLAYEAKLRNARLHYYTGNFTLAKSHLDVLKEATTKEIANDALDLSILIKNNTAFDSTDEVMQRFANIQLLKYQNKKNEALLQLKKFIQENPSHSLSDESHWLLSQLYKEQGEFESSIHSLDTILMKYPQGILGDDALFEKATLMEKYLYQTEQAKELYREFLIAYPGSMYVAEARKRFRSLRGDTLN
jgi:tetratricopeptide (TPR) repeat protein